MSQKRTELDVEFLTSETNFILDDTVLVPHEWEVGSILGLCGLNLIKELASKLENGRRISFWLDNRIGTYPFERIISPTLHPVG